MEYTTDIFLALRPEASAYGSNGDSGEEPAENHHPNVAAAPRCLGEDSLHGEAVVFVSFDESDKLVCVFLSRLGTAFD